MDKLLFRTILQEAVAGDHEALEKILVLYGRLIDKFSYVNGRLDEDLRQYIMVHITLNISKFKIE